MTLTRSNTLRQFWALIRAYWWSSEKVSARLLLFGVVALTLGMVFMNVQINLWQNQFFNALQDKNQPQFYRQLLEKCVIDDPDFTHQWQTAGWPALKLKLAALFRARTRDEWCALLEGTDVCFAPVLSIFEAPDHPHNVARNSFVNVDGVVQPAPSPRFSRTKAEISHGARRPGEDSESVLKDCGFSAQEIRSLQTAGIVPAA